MTKLIADNFMTQMKIKKIPVDIREQIYFEIIDEQVKQNHKDLMTEINEYVDDVKNAWWSAEAPTTLRFLEKQHLTEEIQENFDYFINAEGEDGYADMNYMTIWWFKNYLCNTKKFKGFYNEMGKEWWDCDEPDVDDPRNGYC